MGAWGHGSFENDDALDFLAELLGSGDTSPIREVLDHVLTSTEYVEAPDASQCIAAAEVVAAALGRPTAAALRKQDVAAWIVQVKPRVDATLVAQMAEALTRILAPNSELGELWQESDEFAEWQAAVEEVRSQLYADGAPSTPR